MRALEGFPDTDNEPHITSWLEYVRPARNRVLDAGVPDNDQYLETIKANALMQCENLRTYPCVAHAEKTGELSIHAWLYDLHTGTISAYDEVSATWAAVAEQLP